jgi:hypothetical protein
MAALKNRLKKANLIFRRLGRSRRATISAGAYVAADRSFKYSSNSQRRARNLLKVSSLMVKAVNAGTRDGDRQLCISRRLRI